MEMVTSRGGLRGGRAVMGLDVVSHTLPRGYRTPTPQHQHHPQPPCCTPTAHPHPQEHPPPHHTATLTAQEHPSKQENRLCSEVGCGGCQPDICSAETIPTHYPPPLTPYHAHAYPGLMPGDGCGIDGQDRLGGMEGCVSCNILAPPPCTCADPRCMVGPSVYSWAGQTPSQVQQQTSGQTTPHQPTQEIHMTRASSECALPKLLSIEEHLTTAFGRPPTDQQHIHPPHLHSHPHYPTIHTLNTAVGSRLSRSVEDLPKDIKEHILKCQCSCDHLGYGNFSATSLHHLPGLSNGCSSLSNKSSSREDLSQEPSEKSQKLRGGLEVPHHVWGAVCLVIVLAGVAGVGVSVPLVLRVDPNAGVHERLNTAMSLLRNTPLIDGHNDLPWNIRKFKHNKLHSFNFTAELNKLRPWSKSSWSHTDLPRLKEGMVGAQFWVSYVPCASQQLNAVQLTIEQIDLIKRLIDQYPDDLRLATSADEVEAAFKEGRIASLIGVEGGHAIQNSLGVLRALRDLGVRYLTLTHTCSTPWAECARARETDLEDPNSPRGLTHFGKTVVREMNRLGLLVDLSHVSQATMKAALDVSKAPVIFSHSSVYAICKNPRNVPDDILRKVAMNGGIVMVSFYNHFLTCSDHATVKDVIDHINHVRNIAGIEHVGIGADFDGVNKLPEGLEDVSRYPHLFAELLSDPTWTIEDLKMLAGQNLLRVMRDVEKVRKAISKQRTVPYEEEVPVAQLHGLTNCSYKFTKNQEES